MAMMTATELREALGADASLQARIDSIHAAASLRINRYAPGAPEAVATEALVLYAAWVYQSGAQRRSVFPADGNGPPSTCPARFCCPVHKGSCRAGTSSGRGPV